MTYKSPALIQIEEIKSTKSTHTDTQTPVDQKKLVSTTTSSTNHKDLRKNIKKFLAIYPYTWESAYMRAFHRLGKIIPYYKPDEYRQDIPELTTKIRFRWEMGLLTDYLVQKFDLPLPDKEICMLWNRDKWSNTRNLKIGEPSQASQQYQKIYNALGHSLQPQAGGRLVQGREFFRPTEYFAAALWEGKKSWDEMVSIIAYVWRFMESVARFHRRHGGKGSQG
ncbi:hypothetical protein N7456_005224 [Penicillium angulare]|uniref:Uncharacterized protein n=1 Tax=Penicillium angulare TaxID=116970 RepID=A0A9W9FXY5_9EURO|nr:hypothetical protein N7456_005224 [Penicillium angulare]